MNTDIVTDTTGPLDDGMDGQGVSSSPAECLDGSSLPDDGVARCGLAPKETNHVAAAQVQVDHDESFTHVVAADDSQTLAQEDAATSASQGCQSTTCCTENFAVAVNADSTDANTSSHDPARHTLEPHDAAAQTNAVRCCQTAPQDSNEDIPPHNSQNTATSTLTINNSTSIEDEEDFVAIELVSPTNHVNSTHFMQEEQAGLLAHDHFQSPMSGASFQSNGTAANNVLHDDNDNNNNNNNHNNNNRSHHNHPKKKTIHHPLLSPLTKLPWDKFISAAGACDILFNCKYSMRQVEDEVREEKRTIQYRHDDEAPHRPSVDVEEEEEEQETMQCAERDLEELGLHCCSIIDNDDEDDPEEGVGKREDNHQGCQQDAQQSTSEDTNHMLLMEEERANQSWKNSNPSLDMMLYRQFLDE